MPLYVWSNFLIISSKKNRIFGEFSKKFGPNTSQYLNSRHLNFGSTYLFISLIIEPFFAPIKGLSLYRLSIFFCFFFTIGKKPKRVERWYYLKFISFVVITENNLMALGLLLGSSFETRCDIAVQCVASDKRTNKLMVQDFKIEKHWLFFQVWTKQNRITL